MTKQEILDILKDNSENNFGHNFLHSDFFEDVATELEAKFKDENLKKQMTKMSKDNMAKSLGQDVGLQITELTDEHFNLIYIGRKMVCEQDCNCHAECDKADEYIKQLKTSKQA